MIKKNEHYEVTMESCTQEGYGICRLEGRAVFVAGALAGEKWEILILKVTNTLIWAKAVRLITPSPSRIPNDCINPCGGCSLRHVKYDEELRLKLEHLNSCLRRIGGLDKSVSIIHPSPNTERYRNKAIFAVSQKNGKAEFGFYKPRSHTLVNTGDCLLQSEDSLRTASALIEFMNEHQIRAYDEASKQGTVRHIFWRESSSQALLCIVSARGFGANTNPLVEALCKACQKLTWIVLNINKTEGNTVLAGEFHTLWGDANIEEEICGVRFQISPRAFFQVNAPQAECIYRKVIQYAGKGQSVLDLYCGTGTISLCLAKSGVHVTGVEIVPEAIENAKANAKRNGLPNCKFVCSDAAELRTDEEFDTVVVDPPRKGLEESVIDDIVKLSPDRIVYVSCNPATLARDLACFSRHHYDLQAAEAFDMFPRTAHVETVALLSRRKDEPRIQITMNL